MGSEAFADASLPYAGKNERIADVGCIDRVTACQIACSDCKQSGKNILQLSEHNGRFDWLIWTRV